MAAPTPSASSSRSLSSLDLGALVFLGAVWGAAFLFLRIAAREVGPVWAAEARLVVGASVLAVLFGRRTFAAARGRWVPFVVTGALFSAVPFTLIAIATVTLPAGFTSLLNAATPLFTALIGVAFLGHRLAPRVVVGLFTGIAAVVVLVGWSPLGLDVTTLLAVLAGLGAAASYAVAGNYARAKLADVGPIEIATAMLVAGSMVLLPVAMMSGPPSAPGFDGIVSLVAVGIISTAVAWPIFFRVLRHTTATAASTVTFVVPAFAIGWGALVLGEPIGPNLVAGSALILVSLLLVVGIRVSVPALLARRAVGAARA